MSNIPQNANRGRGHEALQAPAAGLDLPPLDAAITKLERQIASRGQPGNSCWDVGHRIKKFSPEQLEEIRAQADSPIARIRQCTLCLIDANQSGSVGFLVGTLSDQDLAQVHHDTISGQDCTLLQRALAHFLEGGDWTMTQSLLVALSGNQQRYIALEGQRNPVSIIEERAAAGGDRAEIFEHLQLAIKEPTYSHSNVKSAHKKG